MRLGVPFFRRFRRDESGVAATEFALASIPFFFVLFVSAEFGYYSLVRSTVTGTVREAARMATTGQYTGVQIDNYVTTRLSAIAHETPPVIVKRSYASFTGIGQPEPIKTDTAPLGVYNVGDCYEDTNANLRWDADQGSDGLGGAEDVIYYEVSFTYSPLTSLAAKTGIPGTISADTIVSNEPFSAVARAPVLTRCT